MSKSIATSLNKAAKAIHKAFAVPDKVVSDNGKPFQPGKAIEQLGKRTLEASSAQVWHDTRVRCGLIRVTDNRHEKDKNNA